MEKLENRTIPKVQTLSGFVSSKNIVQGAITEIEKSYQSKIPNTKIMELSQNEIEALAEACNLIEKKEPIGIYSQPLSAETLMYYFISLNSEIPVEILKTGRFQSSDINKLTDAASKFYVLNLCISETCYTSPEELRNHATILKKTVGIRKILIPFYHIKKEFWYSDEELLEVGQESKL